MSLNYRQPRPHSITSPPQRSISWRRGRCGDIFASPSTKHALAALKPVPLLITNYTSNRLRFSLAVERVRATEFIENVTVLDSALLDKAVRTGLRDGHHVRVAADGLGYGHGRRRLRRGRQEVVQSVLQRLG
jgi:hypothetical protein